MFIMTSAEILLYFSGGGGGGGGGSDSKISFDDQNDFAQILNGCVFLYRREKISNV